MWCVTVCVCEWDLHSVQGDHRSLPRTRPQGAGADGRLVSECTEPSPARALVPAEISSHANGAEQVGGAGLHCWGCSRSRRGCGGRCRTPPR